LRYATIQVESFFDRTETLQINPNAGQKQLLLKFAKLEIVG
jgi:hypothetical protein